MWKSFIVVAATTACVLAEDTRNMYRSSNGYKSRYNMYQDVPAPAVKPILPGVPAPSPILSGVPAPQSSSGYTAGYVT